MFDHALQFDTGRDIVYRYYEQNNARGMYQDLLAHFTQSTIASINASEVMKYLVTSRYDKTWPSGTKAYILHWTNQARIYNELVDVTKRIPNSMLIQLLQQAVMTVPELRNVQTNSELLAAGGKTNSILDDYQKYRAILLSAATRYDEAHKKSSFGSRRQVMYTGIEDYEEFADCEESTDDFDIDTPIIEVNMARSRLQRPNMIKQRAQNTAIRLPDDLFRTFSDDQKALWIDFKRSLVTKSNTTESYQGRNNTNRLPNRQSRSVNFTDQDQTVDQDATAEAQDGDDRESNERDGEEEQVEDPSDTDRQLLAYIAGRETMAPHDLRRVMSNSLNRHINNHTLIVSQHSRISKRKGTLVDRGASGGVAGDDVRVLHNTNFPPVSVIGVADHEISNLKIATCAALCESHLGPIIVYLHQYAVYGKGKTIHSCAQIEAHGHDICDKSRIVGGKQRIIVDGYVLPLQIRNGLPMLEMRPPTDAEMKKYPEVHLTNPTDHWDPSCMDFEIDINEDNWFECMQEELKEGYDPDIDEFGIIKERVAHYSDIQYSVLDNSPEAEQFFNELEIFLHDRRLEVHRQELFHDAPQLIVPDPPDPVTKDARTASPKKVETAEPDDSHLRKFFGWAPLESIKKTLKTTTQYAENQYLGTFRRSWNKSRFPAANVPRRNEPVASDYIDVGIPAIDDGSTGAQIFYGVDSRVAHAYGVKSSGEFVETLQDEIRKRGAMDMIITDSAKAEVNKKTAKILREYRIDDYQSEPYTRTRIPPNVSSNDSRLGLIAF